MEAPVIVLRDIGEQISAVGILRGEVGQDRNRAVVPTLESGNVCERLERRARLAQRGCYVHFAEGRIRVVNRANHCQYLARARVHSHHGRVRSTLLLYVLYLLGGDALGLGLPIQVNRGKYFEAAPIRHLHAVLLLKGLLHVAHKVGCVGGHVYCAGHRMDVLGIGDFGLLGCYKLVLDHQVEHDLLAGPRELKIAVGVVVARQLGQARQHSRLAEGEILD